MDSPSAWYQVCACGRTFSVLQAYSYHKRSCQKTKKRLASALEKAKEVWEAKKRRKNEEKLATPVEDGCSNRDAVPESTCDGDLGIAPGVHVEVRLVNASYMHSMLRTILRSGLQTQMCCLTTRTSMGHLPSVGSAGRIANYPSVIGMCYLVLQRHFLPRSHLSLQVQDQSCHLL